MAKLDADGHDMATCPVCGQLQDGEERTEAYRRFTKRFVASYEQLVQELEVVHAKATARREETRDGEGDPHD